MDLQKIINQQTEKYIKEKLEETVQNYLSKMMDSVLSDIFSTYGDNSKAIKNAISEKINIDLSQLNIMDYNYMISNAIGVHFENIVKERSVEPIIDTLNSIVGKKYHKDEIDLNEFIDEIKEAIINDMDEEEKREENGNDVSIYANYRITDYGKYLDFKVGNGCGIPKENCQIKFCITGGKYGHIFALKTGDYAGEPKIPFHIHSLSSVEKILYNLSISGTKIKLPNDIEEGDYEFEDLSIYCD